MFLKGQVRKMLINGRFYRIKSNFRFTIFVALAIVLAVLSVNAMLGLNQASGMENLEYIKVIVQPGDTLWDLTKEYMGNDLDPRKGVSIICSMNKTSPEQLKPGDILLIPVNMAS